MLKIFVEHNCKTQVQNTNCKTTIEKQKMLKIFVEHMLRTPPQGGNQNNRENALA